MIFRYVPHARVQDYQSLGWEDRGDAPGHHGVWSRVMIWRKSEEPREPQQKQEARAQS